MFSRRGFILLVAMAATAGPVFAGAVVREEGAVYLEDFLKKPIKLQVLKPTMIYYNSAMSRYLGTLGPGQFVELQAVKDSIYRVRGRARQGGVAGWVQPGTLSPLQPVFLVNLKQNAERAEQIKSLIAKNEVAINMTADEVRASLGKPPQKSSRIDSEGRHETWEYVQYERVPKQVQNYDIYGRLVVTYIFVKEPVGVMAIIFKNNLVTAIERSEGTLTRAGATKIVTAPLEVY